MRISLAHGLRAALAACALGGLIATSATASFADPIQWVGTWNASAASHDLVRIEISGTDGALKIHPFGSCHPTACDLGTVPLTTFGSGVSSPTGSDAIGQATINTGFSTITLLVSGFKKNGLVDTLSVQKNTVFTDKSGRAAYSDTETFTKLAFKLPPPVQPSAEDCISYDATKLALVKISAGDTSKAVYQLRSGNIDMQVLQGEADGLRALQVAKGYTKQCFVGRNNTESNRMEYIMEYYK